MNRSQKSEIGGQKKNFRNEKRRWISKISDIHSQTSSVGYPVSIHGITLIALIITIIVMLILVAVTVSVVVNSGLFKHASDAGESWKQSQEKEQNIGAGNVQVGEYSSINEYLENNPLTDPKLNRNNIKVGDYIAYTPDTASDYSLTKSVSGADAHQTIPQESLKWRVLSVNSDGTVDIVSEMPTTKKVIFKNVIGFNNGVLILNDISKKQYSNTILGVTARSINLIDIEKKLNSSGLAARDAFKGDGGIQYGHTKEYTGDNANIPDIYENTGTTLADRTKDYYTTPTEATSTKKDSITVKQTYYNFGTATPRSYFNDQTFYDMIFGAETSYWIASRYASCYESHGDFGLRSEGSAYFGGGALFSSNGTVIGHKNGLRPVVTLGSNIKISTTGGTADSPRTLSL